MHMFVSREKCDHRVLLIVLEMVVLTEMSKSVQAD